MVAKMGSLSHNVVFHVNGGELLSRDGEDGTRGEVKGEGKEGWFCQEAWTSRSGGGRGTHESRIWDWRARHIVSSWQDGLVMKGVDGEGRGTDGIDAEKARKKHKL
jgi:hypothetical protein